MWPVIPSSTSGRLPASTNAISSPNRKSAIERRAARRAVSNRDGARSVACMLAEPSNTITIRRAARRWPRKCGSAIAITSSHSSSSWTSSETRCRNRRHSDRGGRCWYTCRQNMFVETGTRRSRTRRMYSPMIGSDNAPNNIAAGTANDMG
jgi:hypothetical protein